MARFILAGRPGSPGYGVGRLLWLPSATEGPAESDAEGLEAGTAAVERERLLVALEAAATELETLARETSARAGAEVGAIFEAQSLFARDPGIIDPALAAIEAGATAADAIDRSTAEQADKLASVEDEYFRERAADVRDVGRRIVDHLFGRSRPELHHRDGSPAIVAAEDLDPSLVAGLRPELVAGLALAGGAPSGHAAIVARALGLPLALGLGPELDADLAGRPVAVDGTTGRLLVEPDESDRRPSVVAVDERLPISALQLRVSIAANVSSIREAEAAAAAGADGIGLVRTELLFIGRSTAPSLEEQRAVYRRIARAMEGRPVVFRTLDIGGDKPAAYLPHRAEMNPALGVRGVRLGLRRPDLLETQLRALLEADPESTLRILLPMVAVVEEVTAVRQAIIAAAAASRRAGAAVATEVELGVMVEIPALALAADAFAPIVDFFSIGTNDLVQYTMAADRTNPELADLATPLQPAIMRLVRLVTDAALPHGRPVAVCGEAAADPLAAALFVGLGVDELSVAPGSIGSLRSALGNLDLETCRQMADAALRAGTAAEVRRLASEMFQPAGAGSPAA